jgi:hypothetical protein
MWNTLGPKMIDILVQKGSKEIYPLTMVQKTNSLGDSLLHHTLEFSQNGEKCDWEWLVYNKELDSVLFLLQIIEKWVWERLASKWELQWLELSW